MGEQILKAVCLTQAGKRETHEDNFFLNGEILPPECQRQIERTRCLFCQFADVPTRGCFAVSDGMGGQNAGDVASRICVEHLAGLQRQVQGVADIEEAVDMAQYEFACINEDVCRISRQDVRFSGMGATLVLLVICGARCAVLHVGDSRAYQFDGDSLIQLTRDHTEGQRMLDIGLLTRKELEGFSSRKHLNRYVGYNARDCILQPDVCYPAMERGMIMLCSDGITDVLTDDKMRDILSSELDLEAAGRRIMAQAAEVGGADNATLVLIPIGR